MIGPDVSDVLFQRNALNNENKYNRILNCFEFQVNKGKLSERLEHYTLKALELNKHSEAG